MTAGDRSQAGEVRPLVVRFGALGDLILLTPALRALAQRWGGPCDLVCRRGAHVALDGLPYLGTVRSLLSRRTPYLLDWTQRGLVRWLRRREPSPSYRWDENPRVTRLLERAGLRADCTIDGRVAPRGDLEHSVDYALRLAASSPPAFAASGELEIEPERVRTAEEEATRRPELPLAERDLADCRRWLERRRLADRALVLLQSNSRTPLRGRWPERCWIDTAHAVLAAEPEARVLLLGTPREQRHNRALAAGCADPRIIDVSAELPLRRLYALCTVAHSCISLDTGPAHVAAVFGCPLVLLVSNADPRRNRPIGPAPIELVTAWPEARWPARRHEWEESHDVAMLTVDQVIDAWQRARGAGRSEPSARPHQASSS